MKGIKFKNAQLADVEDMFKVIFVLAGVKKQHIPNQLESLLLYEHLVKQYGNHTLDEMKLAFELAISGELEMPMNEIKTYDNFSVMYVSKILDYYRLWAREKYYRLEHHIDPPKENKLLLEEKPNWGEAIEKSYQHFLLFGKEHMKIWPEYFYNQLVADGYIAKDVFKSQLVGARNKIIGEVIAEKAVKSLRRFPVPGENTQKEITANFKAEENKIDLKKSEKSYTYDPADIQNAPIEQARQIVLKEIKELDKKFEEIENGGCDSEILLRAKQQSVLLLFEKAKETGKQNLYKKFNKL